MHIKAMYHANSDRYGIDADAYQVKKKWFKSLKDAQQWLKDIHSYYTPFRMELLEEGFDWEGANTRSGGSIMLVTVWKDQVTTNLVFSNTNVYILNEDGKTIDTAKIY